MTENLAGLAGLVAATLNEHRQVGTPWTGCCCGWKVDMQNPKVYDWQYRLHVGLVMETALEAAAPAGTAPDVHWAIKAQCAHCVDGYPQRQAGDGYISNLGPVSDGEWFHHGMVHSSSGVVGCAAQYIHEALRRAALATLPPPQAPPELSNAFSTSSERASASELALQALRAWEHWYSEDSTEFNRDMARELGLKVLAPQPPREQFEYVCQRCSGTGGFGGLQCPDCKGEKKLIGLRVPAATQEQPAGSGATSLQATNDETRGDVCEGNAPRLLAESPSTFGSPRKVGEDGAPKLRPTYYVRHPDDTFSIADPQPVKEFKAILQQRILREAADRVLHEIEINREAEYARGSDQFTKDLELLARAALSLSSPIEPPCKCENIYVEAGDATWSDVDTTKCSIHGARPTQQASSEVREVVESIAQEMCALAAEKYHSVDGYAYEKLGKYGKRILEALAPSRQGAAKCT